MKQQKLQSLNFIFGKKTEVTDFLFKQILQKKSLIVLPASLNDLAVTDADQNLKKIYKKVNFCVTDGMPIVWFLFWKNFIEVERVYGPTLMTDILSVTNNNLKHFFYGSSERTIVNLKNELKNNHLNLQIVGMVSPPYRQLSVLEEAHYVSEIRRKKADVLWLGISSPNQVQLAVRWKKFLPNTVIFCVGAAFDYVAGTTIKPPVLMQKVGLEWLFRLMTNPRRLAKRYLLDIPKFLFGRLF